MTERTPRMLPEGRHVIERNKTFHHTHATIFGVDRCLRPRREFRLQQRGELLCLHAITPARVNVDKEAIRLGILDREIGVIGSLLVRITINERTFLNSARFHGEVACTSASRPPARFCGTGRASREAAIKPTHNAREVALNRLQFRAENRGGVFLIIYDFLVVLV